MSEPQRIGLIGYGVENASAYRYLRARYPHAVFTVYDQRDKAPELPDGVEFVGGLESFTDIDADLCVRSPGISPYLINPGVTVTTATRIFFDTCPAPVIGVTGTKGKGTTSSLIAGILRAGGKTAWLVGNIGDPALDSLDHITSDHIVVYELSSFQLWDIDKSPHTAVVLMIESEHLDVHRDLADYLDAKAHIARFQGSDDLLIYNAENDFSRHIAEQSAGRHVGYPSHAAAHVRDGSFCYGETVLCPIDTLQLVGQHNIDNTLAAIDAAWNYVNDPEAIAQGIAGFTGLPHRLKFVREFKGVSYYDDSISTTPGSAIAAIKAFNDTNLILILGGSSKGADFSELAREVVNSHAVRRVFVVGQEGERIIAALHDAGYTDVEAVEPSLSMADVVALCAGVAQPNDRVVLSPACASFGQFKNYADRGDQFTVAVNGLEA